MQPEAAHPLIHAEPAPAALPTVSFCVPTYNRARYLRNLLDCFVNGIGELRHSYEIVISDNASTDDTEALVGEYASQLNIRYMKREKNYDAYDNREYAMEHAHGEFLLYVADDDAILFPELSALIDQMLADPRLGVVYAPWQVQDAAHGKVTGQFYYHTEDVRIEQGDFGGLLKTLLDHGAFPEIYVCRRSVFRAVHPRVGKIAYWAFVNAAEYVASAPVLFCKTPFYIFIAQHFVGDRREQTGNQEVMEAWDRYRGGLEYILSRIPTASLDPARLTALTSGIQQVIAGRVSVALRFRLARNADPIDSYYLACRLKAMGYGHFMPKRYEDIAFRAAVTFLCRDERLLHGVEKLVWIGEPHPWTRQFLLSNSPVPVAFETAFEPEALENALVCHPGSRLELAIDPAWEIARNVHVIGFDDLLRKFSLSHLIDATQSA